MALIAVVVCASRGLVARGLLAGAVIGCLGFGGFIMELVTASAADRHDFKTSQAGLVLVFLGIGAQVVTMAVAVAGQKSGVARLKKRKRVAR
jgi:hypothetical protein